MEVDERLVLGPADVLGPSKDGSETPNLGPARRTPEPVLELLWPISGPAEMGACPEGDAAEQLPLGEAEEP